VTLPRELVSLVRRLDEPQLRRLLILARGLLLRSEGPTLDLDETPRLPAVRYRQETVRCGKDCRACPHGPYWYAYWREGGRTRSQYIGRELPGDVRRLLEAESTQAAEPARTGQPTEHVPD
jgi:hypothetical protein